MSTKTEKFLDEREAKIQRMQKILQSHGIEMSVGACGCCQSPWVSFAYQGEVLFDDENNLSFGPELYEAE